VLSCVALRFALPVACLVDKVCVLLRAAVCCNVLQCVAVPSARPFDTV